MRFILIFFLICTALLADVDQKQILMKEANRFSLRRQYEQAINIYQDLLEEYPDGTEIAEKLISNYLLTSQLDKAETLLAEKREIFQEVDQVKLGVTLLLAKSEVDKARKASLEFLTANPGRLNYYKTFATLFQRYRQYNQAIELLLQAREIAQDEYLYTHELANNYYQVNDHKNSIKEYFKHVEKNKAYKNYVQNKLKIILKQEPASINTVQEFAELSNNQDIQEIYAVCLGETGNIVSALNVYQELDSKKLFNYARTLKQTGDYQNALLAFEKYQQIESSPVLLAEAKLAVAQIYWQQKKYADTERLLLEIYQNQTLQERKFRYKTRANRICREMLSDLALLKGETDKVIAYLEAATKFTYNQKEIKDIEFKMIHYKLMSNDLNSAAAQLFDVLKDEDPASEIFKKGTYYEFLLSLFKQESTADSLLGELLINLPESDHTNDAIEISLLLNQLQPEEKKKFLEAVRKDQVFNTEEAVMLLKEIYASGGNEQVLILAGEWSLRNKNIEKARQIFDTEFSDQDLAQYALLMNAQLQTEAQGQENITEKFLAENPRSVFAPAFRRLLSEQ